MNIRRIARFLVATIAAHLLLLTALTAPWQQTSAQRDVAIGSYASPARAYISKLHESPALGSLKLVPLSSVSSTPLR